MKKSRQFNHAGEMLRKTLIKHINMVPPLPKYAGKYTAILKTM